MRFILLGFFILSVQNAFAFPEMVRHGYFSCTTCHVSPSGGGVLTEYGRSLSKELMSTWGSEGEENFLYAVPTGSETIHLGGDVRSIQTYLNDPAVRTGDYFLMQSDVEVALTLKNWIVDVTAGTQGGPKTLSKKDTFISRRHFVGYKANDELTVRYGRFLTNFGWNQANHTMVTERDLQFDQGRETYNTEVSYLGEKFGIYLTHMNGRPDDPDVDGERGAALSSVFSLGEKSVIGVSGLTGKTNGGGTRQLAGLYGLLSINEHFFWLYEIDHQWLQPNNSPGLATEQKGVAAYSRLNWEAYKGIHVYTVEQLRYFNYHAARTRLQAYGLGVQFFPRPHVEINAEFQKQQDISRYDDYYDFAWLLLHFYL